MMNKSTEKLSEVFDKINEEGLMDQFKQILEKADNLRISFFKFLSIIAKSKKCIN